MPKSITTLALVLSLGLITGCTTTPTTQSSLDATSAYSTNQDTTTNPSIKNNNNHMPAPRDFTAGLQLPVQDTSEYTTTASGLKYKDLTNSRSEEAAKAGDLVTVDYTGMLENGKQFDSSMTRSEAFQFTLGAGEVIAGWDEGIAGMTLGQERILIIPANLAYGNQAVGGVIPAGSALQFEVKLQGIN